MRREAQKGVGMEDGVACWRGRGGGGVGGPPPRKIENLKNESI